MSIHKSILFSCLALFVLGIISCKKDKAISPESCSAKTYSFANDINPIIQANCAINNCHGTNNQAPFNLFTYGQIDTAVRFYGLLRAIKHEGPIAMPRIDPALPAATKLPDSSIRAIECWIEQGRLNN